MRPAPRFGAIGAEEFDLCRAVGFHVGVIVEMVVTEVEEAHDVEDEAVDPIPGQSLCAHFEHHGAHLALAHPSEQPPWISVASGVVSVAVTVSEPILRSRSSRGRPPGRAAGDSVQQVRHAGLAIRASDAEQKRRQLFGAVYPRRDGS